MILLPSPSWQFQANKSSLAHYMIAKRDYSSWAIMPNVLRVCLKVYCHDEIIVFPCTFLVSLHPCPTYLLSSTLIHSPLNIWMISIILVFPFSSWVSSDQILDHLSSAALLISVPIRSSPALLNSIFFAAGVSESSNSLFHFLSKWPHVQS